MDTTEARAEVARPAKRSWRRHGDEFKAHVVAMARQPGTSMAAVALANGLNANMLRRWVREFEAPAARSSVRESRSTPVASFVQLPMVPPQALPPAPTPSTVEVTINRGDTKIVLNLPLGSASAAWLREVLG